MHRTGAIHAHSYWQHCFLYTSFSTLEIYDLIEITIREMRMPKVYVKRVLYPEGGIFDARRAYLRIARKGMTFLICAAPMGSTFFISWRVRRRSALITRLLSTVPPVRKLAEWVFYPHTYYKIDAQEAFQKTVHSLMLAVCHNLGDTRVYRRDVVEMAEGEKRVYKKPTLTEQEIAERYEAVRRIRKAYGIGEKIDTRSWMEACCIARFHTHFSGRKTSPSVAGTPIL